MTTELPNEDEMESTPDLQTKIHYLLKVVDQVPADIYWKNKEGFYLGMNDRGRRSLHEMGFFDISEEIAGKTDLDIYGKDIADNFRNNDIKVMESCQSESKEEEATLPSGKKITQLSIKSPLYDDSGNVIGIVGNTVDITSQKELERKLIAANKTKSDFMANMSHDLRTPMTGVMGMLEEIICLVKDIENSPDRSLEYVKDIDEYAKVGKDSANALLTLFNEIIGNIKQSSGQEQAEKFNFSLGTRLDRTIDMLGSTAADKNLEIKKSISPNLPPYFLGDRHGLDRILTNLVSNALKFTKEGSVEISADLVSSGPLDVGSEVKVRICVSDTGIGIPEDKFESIFENFSRLNPSYEGQYEGNGLGLYSVKLYVESMNGKISVESEVGKGSRFILDLPLMVSDHSDQEEEVKPAPSLLNQTEPSSSSIEKPNWKSVNYDKSDKTVAKALVVEDNTAAAMSIQRSLKRLGCEIDHAKTGEDSVIFAMKNKYDIIFMDIGLPGISGLEATKKIRDFSSNPIIAVTGHVDKSGICIEAGMQELLTKPATPSSLEAMLNRHVIFKNEDIDKLNDGQTIIDWPCCVRMHEGDEEIAKEILDMFHEEIVKSDTEIDNSYGQKNIKRLRDELHKVRGGICYLRIPQLERALRDFHLTLKEDPLSPSNMESEYQKLKNAIRNFLEAYENAAYLTSSE